MFMDVSQCCVTDSAYSAQSTKASDTLPYVICWDTSCIAPSLDDDITLGVKA